MSRRRHRTRIAALEATAREVARPDSAVRTEALDRARVRLGARLKLELGDELTDDEAAALDDRTQADRDARTVRRDLEARGDSVEAIRRRLLARAYTDPVVTDDD